MRATEDKTKKVHPMVPVPEAIRTVIHETARIMLEVNSRSSEKVSSDAPWDKILGNVLDEDVIMADPGYPPYNASIMDGYAIQTSEEFQRNGDKWTHTVVGKSYAGDEKASSAVEPPKSTLPIAYYITTGAVIPASCNCVVPIEECKVSNDRKQIQILPSATIQDQKWIRPIGCDIPAGSIVLPRGHVMDPVGLGLLKQSGAEEIYVKKKVAVGVLSTGNELILGKSGENSPGMIPDVNRPILLSLLSSYANCKPMDLGMQRDDDVKAMAQTVDGALQKCDVIITTGGISMGETDIVEQVLIEHCGGKLHFGRMHMKPGKPTTFVTIPKQSGTTIVFAMPGNPVSATVCTNLLVKPCLDLLFRGLDFSIDGSNENFEARLSKVVNDARIHPEIECTLLNDVKLDAHRPEYHRVTISRQPNGSFGVSTTGVQRSSRLMSCRDAEGLLVLPVAGNNKPKALKGEIYPVLLLGQSIGIEGVTVRNSIHLGRKIGKEMRAAVIEIIPKASDCSSRIDVISAEVKKALSGSKSGNTSIVAKKSCGGSVQDVYSFAIDSNDADFIVVVYPTDGWSFKKQLQLSSEIQKHLEKIADSMALQVRQGAASEDPVAATFETIVGYSPERKGAMMVCMSDRGIVGGLGNIRGLLKHALNVARGKPHNHHHSHRNVDHATR